MPTVADPRSPGFASLAVAIPALFWCCAASAVDPATVSPAGRVPRLDHILVVVMENKPYDQARRQPYTASLVASGASFSNYYAIAYPSQPNYLALWSGSTQGVQSNECPAPGSPFHGANLGQACEAAGLTWRAYVEDLPAPGSPACTAADNRYTRKHCPWTHWANLDHRNERPFAALGHDIETRNLPHLGFVIPNNCHNTHNGGNGCRPADGDACLAANLPAMVEAVGPQGMVVLTWDEDDKDHSNHILTVFKGPPVRKGYVAGRRMTHYTLLRTLCDALGLAPLGAAARETPITDVWAASLAAPTGQRAPVLGR